MSDYRTDVARAIHYTLCPAIPDAPCDVDWRAADAVLAVPNPDVERLRRRIHEAVDDTQRRYAKYQRRCDDFDRWSAWARQRYEKYGHDKWLHVSEAERLLVKSFVQDAELAIAERDAAVEELRENTGVLRALRRQRDEAEQALDALRSTCVVLPEDWRDRLGSEIGEAWLDNAVGLIESWMPPLEAASVRTPAPKDPQTSEEEAEDA